MHFSNKILVIAAAVVVALLPLSVHPQEMAPPKITIGPVRSTDGFYVVRWKVRGELKGSVPDYTLEESPDESFAAPRSVYRGTDTATVISGKENGTYYYRVRYSQAGPWSQVVSVVVKHHSLERAFLFLFLGGGIFLATATLILGGHWKSRREVSSD